MYIELEKQSSNKNISVLCNDVTDYNAYGFIRYEI